MLVNPLFLAELEVDVERLVKVFGVFIKERHIGGHKLLSIAEIVAVTGERLIEEPRLNDLQKDGR